MSKEVKWRELNFNNEVRPRLKHLQGRILTIIDATISDKNQNKALKDLINTEFNEANTYLYGITKGIFDLEQDDIEDSVSHKIIN